MFDSTSSTLLTPTSSNHSLPSTAQMCPWLMSLTYTLGHHFILASYFSQIQVTGLHHIPLQGPVIIAPTHRSRWDALIVPYTTGRLATGRDLRYMVTADEMRGLQGWFIRKMGGFAVNTKQPTIAAFRHGVNLLCQGQMLVVFPEGNIFRDSQVHHLKSGLARLAIQAQSYSNDSTVKIVPIALDYHPTIPRFGCRVNVKIGSPLSVADYPNCSGKKKAQSITQDLHSALQQLDEATC
ncbi:MAG: 1-acyl-sn-glycerol-3-phosphate acyltransferase [Microcoleaceae cyanobacterium]